MWLVLVVLVRDSEQEVSNPHFVALLPLRGHLVFCFPRRIGVPKTKNKNYFPGKTDTVSPFLRRYATVGALLGAVLKGHL